MTFKFLSTNTTYTLHNIIYHEAFHMMQNNWGKNTSKQILENQGRKNITTVRNDSHSPKNYENWGQKSILYYWMNIVDRLSYLQVEFRSRYSMFGMPFSMTSSSISIQTCISSGFSKAAFKSMDAGIRRQLSSLRGKLSSILCAHTNQGSAVHRLGCGQKLYIWGKFSHHWSTPWTGWEETLNIIF